MGNKVRVGVGVEATMVTFFQIFGFNLSGFFIEWFKKLIIEFEIDKGFEEVLASIYINRRVRNKEGRNQLHTKFY